MSPQWLVSSSSDILYGQFDCFTGVTSTFADQLVQIGYTSNTVVVTPTYLTSAPSNLLPVTATSITLSGGVFDTTSIARDLVSFDNGVTGVVSAASSGSLTVNVTGLAGVTGGTALHATATVDGFNTGSPIQIGTVVPVVAPNTGYLAATATAMRDH